MPSLTLDFKNSFHIDPAHGISDTELMPEVEKLSERIKGFKSRNQGFYQVIDDESVVEEVLVYADSVKGKFDDVLLLGIGGSSLGPITIRDCFQNFVTGTIPRLHVLENIDPDFLADVVESVDLARTLVLVVTKSGGTPETLAEYMWLRSLFDQADLAASVHFVFVTDPEKSFLLPIAKRDNIKTFAIPENVGGRFSVLTPVGLLPAALMGIDIQQMLQGAQNMRESFLSEDFEKNLPYQVALAQFGLYKKGKTNVVMMPYSTKLRSFAAWYTQLLAESTGKFDADGKNVGLTPIPSLGATDQHSQLQLFAEGPNDKQILFLNILEFGKDIDIPLTESGDKVDFLEGKSFAQLLHAEQKGTAASLTERNRPNAAIIIPSLTPETLGELFMLFEGATAFLGEFLNIDAFDQPGVERSKVLTRENL